MMHSNTQSPTCSNTSTHDHDNQEILSRNINNIIDSIPSARRRTRLQTTAYLLGARQELPEVTDEEISHIRAVQLCYPSEAQASTEERPEQPQAFEKGNSDGRLE
jgi:hypothetical protein